MKIFRSIGDYLNTVPGLARIIAIVFLLFWMSHFLGCMWHFLLVDSGAMAIYEEELVVANVTRSGGTCTSPSGCSVGDHSRESLHPVSRLCTVECRYRCTCTRSTRSSTPPTTG